MKKIKKAIDVGLGLVSKRASKKQQEEHDKIAKENQRKFMELWKEKYGKDIKAKKPLNFFEDDKDE